MACLFASLPLASRLILGVGGFDDATEIAFICFVLGGYFHLVSRPGFRAVPDAATILDQAIQVAGDGKADEAIVLLTEAIRLTPRLWQAFQYRGQLYLYQHDSVDAALDDFSEAIRLAPKEHHLYLLRGQAHRLQGDEVSAQADFEAAAALSGTDDLAIESGTVPNPQKPSE
jgi:tetratricopeptide (TPR) repeat protein